MNHHSLLATKNLFQIPPFSSESTFHFPSASGVALSFLVVNPLTLRNDCRDIVKVPTEKRGQRARLPIHEVGARNHKRSESHVEEERNQKECNLFQIIRRVVVITSVVRGDHRGIEIL